jgi:Flp pilus assembly protein TadD
MHLRNIIACTLVLALAGAALAQSKPPAASSRRTRAHIGSSEAEFKKAVEAAQARDFPTAEPLLKKAAEEDPKNYQAWFYLGYVYSETNRDDLAIAAYRKAVELQPTVIESNLDVAVLLAQQGSSDAGRYLRSAAKLKPTPDQTETIAKVWMMLATKLQASDPAGAVDAYQTVADLHPKDPAPLIELGQMLEARKDLAGAEKAYKQALVRDPNSGDVLAVLSNIYMQTDRLQDAEQSLTAFLKTNPASVNGHLQLGRVLRKEQKTVEAAAEFEKALELKPGDEDALKELSAVQLADKNYAAAEASLRNLVAKRPSDPELHFLLANTLSRASKFPEAQEEYWQAIKLKPNWGEAYGEFAVVAAQNKDYGRAIQGLNARAKFLQETPGTYFLRATCYDHLRAYKEATEQYKQFLQVADGKFPDQEWQARHRLIAIDPESKKK